MPVLRKLVLYSAALFLSPACFRGEGKSPREAAVESAMNREIWEFSPALGLLSAHNSIGESASCLWTSLEANPKTGDSSNAILESIKVKNAIICTVYEAVKQQHDHIVSEAMSTSELPDEAFLFYRSHEPDGRSSENSESPIGLFRTLSDCQAAEAHLRSVDIATRPCRDWRSEMLYQLGRRQPENS